jgi:hypothetical protein
MCLVNVCRYSNHEIVESNTHMVQIKTGFIDSLQIQVICVMTLKSISKYQAQPLYVTDELFRKIQVVNNVKKSKRKRKIRIDMKGYNKHFSFKNYFI